MEQSKSGSENSQSGSSNLENMSNHELPVSDGQISSISQVGEGSGAVNTHSQLGSGDFELSQSNLANQPQDESDQDQDPWQASIEYRVASLELSLAELKSGIEDKFALIQAQMNNMLQQLQQIQANH